MAVDTKERKGQDPAGGPAGSPGMWDALVDRQQGYLNFTPGLLAALRETRVAVLGCGGNGVVASHLVRLGFERFVLVDPDVVEPSNLNRLPFGAEAVGLPKVEAWRRYLLAVNPGCEISVHRRALTRRDGAWLDELLAGADLACAGTTSVEANLLIGRACARLRRRLLVGPASSGAWVVSTFTHEGGVTMESLLGLGTEAREMEDVDFAAVGPRLQALLWYPGRRRRYAPGVPEAVRSGELPARSCTIFVALANAAMAFEAVKNVAALRGLPWEGGGGVVAMPVLHVFDPCSGCAYYYDIQRRAVGIPDWLTGEVAWRPCAGD